MDNKNSQQDIEIIKVKTEVKALGELLKDFIGNHFSHLRQRVDWIFYLIITTLISVVIKLLFF